MGQGMYITFLSVKATEEGSVVASSAVMSQLLTRTSLKKETINIQVNKNAFQ